MPRKSEVPIFTRNGRHYLDARAYEDVGGKKMPLVPQGEKLATTDPLVARKLAADHLKDFEEKRRNRSLLGIERTAQLADFVSHHLVEKARAGKVTDLWLAETERRLRMAVDHFGAGRDLRSVSPQDVRDWATALGKLPGRGGAGRTLSGGSVRHFLNALSNLYQRAQVERVVALGYNPVAVLLEKPTAKRQEARWLEGHEAALLLESARTWAPKRADVALPFLYPLLATFLLTGGRESEVLGLEVGDISFDRETVTFRPNEWRRLKTLTSHRSVPLWPQLRDALQPYIFDRRAPLGSLLFPSHRVTREAMLHDWRKPLDAVAERVGWKPGEIRSKMFRHTYTSTRLQTLDRGHPVSEFTVARELGHGGTELVRRVYGHLGAIRHRSEAVEYRPEQHLDVTNYRERLRVLNGG